MQQLLPNALLQGGKYKIEKVLGQGGFGITYLAEQVMLGRKVAIKEFFMKELCERDETTSHVTLGTEGSRDTVNRFREKFLKEARNIAKLNHPHIVRIIDVFEENGTAYYVMEYAEGGSLADKAKKEGYLSEPAATRYILQVAEALDYIHQRKMNHLDIKPANIMINEKDEAVLIDFGLSKQYDATTGNQTSTTPVGISEGYAPMEQYKQGGVGEFSPETDIYALGATFFKLLTGITPPSAADVMEDGVPVNELKVKGVSQATIEVICKAMEGRKRDRMKDVRLFIDAIKKHTVSKIGNSSPQFMTEQTVQFDESTILTSEIQDREEAHQHRKVVIKAQEENSDTRVKVETEFKDQESRQRVDKRTVHGKSQKNGTKIKCLIVGICVIVIAIAYLCLENITHQASYSDGVLTVNGVTYNMVEVQPGTFTMGATTEMKNASENEKPAHKVNITKTYFIGKTEVTQALWEAVMGFNGSQFKGSYKPVECVTWDDCKIFISKLNSMTGQKFRLPTEAEWEFAARGGNKSKQYQYSGSNNIADVAWYRGNSENTTHDVATKQPNELGIYDMSGNVYEWCSDWYGNYSISLQINPLGSKSGQDRVDRGGSWERSARECRSSCRGAYMPFLAAENLGFRLALSY